MYGDHELCTMSIPRQLFSHINLKKLKKQALQGFRSVLWSNLSLVGLFLYDGKFWMFSEGGRKFIGLEKNSHVCLAIYDKYDGFGNLRSLQVTGIAAMVEPFSERSTTPMLLSRRSRWTL